MASPRVALAMTRVLALIWAIPFAKAVSLMVDRPAMAVF